MAKVTLICGRICCGKTTYAKELQQKHRAVILSVDEIMLAIFGQYAGEKHDAYTEAVKLYLYQKSAELTAAGVDVILDWGFWTRHDRARARAFFGARQIPCELHHLDVDDAVWQARVEKRNAQVSAGDDSAYYIDRKLAEKFAAMFEPSAEAEIDVTVT